jgi:hypothetical protein
VEFTIYSTDLHDALDAYSASVHEFRIPPKALLGLHSYCPVHFDALHAALVDVSVHVSLLRALPNPSALKVPRFVHLIFSTNQLDLHFTIFITF